jgi:hypothetical protein
VPQAVSEGETQRRLRSALHRIAGRRDHTGTPARRHPSPPPPHKLRPHSRRKRHPATASRATPAQAPAPLPPQAAPGHREPRHPTPSSATGPPPPATQALPPRRPRPRSDFRHVGFAAGRGMILGPGRGAARPKGRPPSWSARFSPCLWTGLWSIRWRNVYRGGQLRVNCGWLVDGERILKLLVETSCAARTTGVEISSPPGTVAGEGETQSHPARGKPQAVGAEETLSHR